MAAIATLGLDAGAFLPRFADAQNVALDRDILALRQQLQTVDTALLDHTDTIGVLKEHVGRAEKDVVLASFKLAESSRAFAHEEHLHQLDLRNLEKLATCIRGIARHDVDAQSRLQLIASQQAKNVKLLEAFREAQAWSEDQFKQWTKLQAAKEADNLALELYKRQDESALKQLSFKLQRHAKEVTEIKLRSAAEQTRTQQARMQLFSARAELTAKATERKESADQRLAIAEKLIRRGGLVEEASKRLEAKQSAVEVLRDRLTSVTAACDAEQKRNSEIEAEIARCQKNADWTREAISTEARKLQSVADANDLLASHHDDVKRDLKQCQNDMNAARERMSRQKEEERSLVEKREKVAKETEEQEQEAGTIDSKTASLEQLLKEEKLRMKKARDDKQAATKQYVKFAQALADAELHSKELLSRVAGNKMYLKNMKDAMSSLRARDLQQEDMLFRVRYKLVMVEGAADKAAGQVTKDESKAFEAVIADLEAKLKDARSDSELLAIQTKASINELNDARRRGNAGLENKRVLNDEVVRARLQGDACGRSLKTLDKERGSKLVAKDVLAVEVHRKRISIVEQTAALIRLQGDIEALQLSAEEQLILFKAESGEMLAEVKLLKAEEKRLAREIQKEQQQANLLSMRFDTVCLKYGTTDDEENNLAEKVIRAAEELHHLKEGVQDKVASVEHAMSDLHGLEMALVDVNASNLDLDNHSRTFTTRLGESIKKQEAEDVKLREVVAQAGDKLKTLQLDRDSLKDKQCQYTAALEESESILNSLKVHMESEVAVQADLTSALEAQRSKLQRASTASKQRERAAVEKSGDKEIVEKVKFSLLSDVNAKALQEIRNAAEGDSSTELITALTVRGVNVPQRPSLSKRASTVSVQSNRASLTSNTSARRSSGLEPRVSASNLRELQMSRL